MTAFLIGEGGKKKVYLAHDELLDRDIAFALIKSEGLDDISRERITREAQAMGRLGSHPHIVTVLDLGRHGDQPYMVVELLADGDVEGVVEDAPDHKLLLEQAIRIAIETCRGLDFAHRKGIIHSDLKPGNHRSGPYTPFGLNNATCAEDCWLSAQMGQNVSGEN